MSCFSAYVPLGPKYATCLRMINSKKKEIKKALRFMKMQLSFDAKQKLKLSILRNKEYLSKYLLEEERVVGAMWTQKLVPEGKVIISTVTSFKVFQLDINPVVLIRVENKDNILRMSAMKVHWMVWG